MPHEYMFLVHLGKYLRALLVGCMVNLCQTLQEIIKLSSEVAVHSFVFPFAVNESSVALRLCLFYFSIVPPFTTSSVQVWMISVLF